MYPKLNSLLLLFSLAITLQSEASIADSEPPFTQLIQTAINDNLPFYVLTDSGTFYIENVQYDEYHEVISGYFTPASLENLQVYPRFEIIASGFSSLENSKEQIRKLDISSAIIRKIPIIHEFGEKPFKDRLIMKNGDTITCRINKISEFRVEYQIERQRIKRIYGKEKSDIQMIIHSNGTMEQFNTPDRIPERKRKEKIAGKIALMTFLFISLFAIIGWFGRSLLI